MTILITGSSGKTARRLATLLKPSHPILIASRSGADVDGSPAVKFDWTDATTYTHPYSHAQAQKSPIIAVYLVTQPGNMNPFAIMKPFIDVAKAHGVERFVLLSSIREDETTEGTGKVHAYLKGSGVEWAVLRPTYFMGKWSDCVSLDMIGQVEKSILPPPRREFLRAAAPPDHQGVILNLLRGWRWEDLVRLDGGYSCRGVCRPDGREGTES